MRMISDDERKLESTRERMAGNRAFLKSQVKLLGPIRAALLAVSLNSPEKMTPELIQDVVTPLARVLLVEMTLELLEGNEWIGDGS